MKYDGRRVRVLRLDGSNVDFNAQLVKHNELDCYVLTQTSDKIFEGRKMFYESDEYFGTSLNDYFYVLDQEEDCEFKYNGRIVRVTRLDWKDVDFIARLTLNKDKDFYEISRASVDKYKERHVLLEDAEDFGEDLCDYYYEIDTTEKIINNFKERFGLLSEDTVEYNDDQLAKSYSEALSEEENEGKTIGQLLDVEFGDINFVSDVDKELSTISSKSLDFVEKDLDKDEMVHSPAHYNAGKYEVIDMLEVMADGYEDPKVAYLVATAGKYLFRAPFKGNTKQDIEKAVWYLNRALTHL